MKEFDASELLLLKREKIDDSARFYVLAGLGVETGTFTDELIETYSLHRPNNEKLHAAALCLYANLFITKILTTKVDKLEAEYVGSLEDAKARLRAKPKYAMLTDEQLEAEIDCICLADVRNSFAHGSFEIVCPNSNPKNGMFVLHSKRSKIEVPHELVVKFETVFKRISEYLILETVKFRNSENYVKKAAEDMGKTLDEFVVPSSLQALVDYYFHPHHPLHMKKTLSSVEIQSHLQNALSYAMFAITQNDFYDIFGFHSETFDMASVFRNSWIHNYTKTSENGESQIVDDPQNSRLLESIVDDKLTISEVMELLHTQKIVFEKALKDGVFTKEQIASMSLAECQNYVNDVLDELYETDDSATEDEAE